MWGFFGFGTAALVFALFAIVSNKVILKPKETFGIKQFSYAFVLMVGAFAGWAFACVFGDGYSLLPSLVVGDILLIAASFLMLDAYVSPKFRLYTRLLSLLVAAVFFYYRFDYFDANPVMQNSVYIFNTPRVLAVFLAFIFAGCWLVSNLKFGKIIFNLNKKYSDFWTIYYVANIFAFVGFSGFIIARRPITVIISFGIIVFSYLTMASVTYALTADFNPNKSAKAPTQKSNFDEKAVASAKKVVKKDSQKPKAKKLVSKRSKK